MKLPFRIFRCRACNYDMRYGTSTCSYCFKSTPLRNRLWMPPLVAAVAVGVVMAAA